MVTLLRSCRACQAQCEGSCSDYDATLLIKRSFVNAEFCRSNPIMQKERFFIALNIFYDNIDLTIS